MSTVLHLDSSARTTGSVTRDLSQDYVDRWLAARAGRTEVYRDLTAEPTPFVSDTWIAAAFSPTEGHDHAQRFALARSNALVDELVQADHLVIGAPVYNLSIPASLKAWIDQIARAGRTFSYGAHGPEGLVRGKSAVIISASGGDPTRTDAAGKDFSTSYLATVLGFIGITDVEVVRAWGVGPDDLTLTRTTDQARRRLGDLAASNRAASDRAAAA